MCEEASSGQILDNEMPAGRPESSQTGLRYSSATARGSAEEDHMCGTELGGRQLHEACLDCDSSWLLLLFDGISCITIDTGEPSAA